VHWEHEPEYLGPKRNRVLGGGKRASEWVNRWRNERLLETLGVVAPGLGSSEVGGVSPLRIFCEKCRNLLQSRRK
jgi:hypothetical protein